MNCNLTKSNEPNDAKRLFPIKKLINFKTILCDKPQENKTIKDQFQGSENI